MSVLERSSKDRPFTPDGDGSTAPDRNRETSSTPRVLVIVLNWNGGEVTRRCVEQVRRQDRRASDLLLVDNGSTDGSLEQLVGVGLRRHELLALPANLGFTGGMNAGLKVARDRSYEYVWLLNNDAFPEPDCLDRLVDVMEANPRAGIASPHVSEVEGDAQLLLSRISWDQMRIDPVVPDAGLSVLPTDVWFMGAALLLRGDCLREIGGFDERFFAYLEDADLCLRCQRAGWDVRYVADARCAHVGGSSSGGGASPFVSYMTARNSWLFARKFLPLWKHPWAFCRLSSESLRHCAALAGLGRRESASAVVGGIFAAALGETGTPRRIVRMPTLTRILVNRSWRIGRLLARFSTVLPH